MELNFEKEQLESIYFMLNEMSLGNMCYKLKISGFDNNKDYDTIATYINGMANAMEDLISGRPLSRSLSRSLSGVEGRAEGRSIKTQDLYGEARMEFFLTSDFCVKQVNDVVTDIFNKDPEELHNLYFDELLTEEYRLVWDTLEESVLPYLNSPFYFEFSFDINTWVECPAYCRFSCHPEDRLIRVSVPKIYTKPTIDGLMDRPYLVERPKEPVIPVAPSHPDNPDSPDSYRDRDRDSEKTPPRDAKEKAIREVARYIEAHLDESLPSPQELAKIFGMNREKLRDHFKRLFKVTIYEFYTTKRMEKAKRMLLNTDMPVKEIAAVLSYKVPSSFYRAFKQKYGCSPGKIRKDRSSGN